MKNCTTLFLLLFIGYFANAQINLKKKEFLFSDTFAVNSIFNYYKGGIVESKFVADIDYPEGTTMLILSGKRVIDTQKIGKIKKGEVNIKIVKIF